MGILRDAVGIGYLWNNLANQGYEVEELTDMSAVHDAVEAAGKAYLTPFNSPAHNDFTQKSALWLVARKEGVPAFLGCARLEDLGSERLDQYWPRVFSRAYGDSANKGAVIRNVGSDIATEMSGRLVYFGDLFVSPSVRGSRSALRSFVALGHLAVSLKWDPDWTYCFVRERDLMRGAAALYGFTRHFGAPFEWIEEPPTPRSRSERLVGLPRRDLGWSVSAAVSAIMSEASELQTMI